MSGDLGFGFSENLLGYPDEVFPSETCGWSPCHAYIAAFMGWALSVAPADGFKVKTG